MCGIAGCIDKNDIDKDRFEEMVDLVRHRGPNDRGVYYEQHVALGHRRLSIIDLSEEGHQPFFYKERYVVVFNGEIYNYIELREELITKGYKFRTKTDTEVLVACYDYYGKNCVNMFNGMWSFAIYDKDNNYLFCSRDRFGVKPFYYYTDDNSLIFASEIKQIIHMKNERFCVNRTRLMEYLMRGIQDHTEETMVADVLQLRGGFNLEYDLNSYTLKLERYYDIAKTKIDIGLFEKAKSKFRTLFTDAVNLRLRSDVPLGYCLSGGLDSSAIVCTADDIVRKNKMTIHQESVSSCFDDKRYDEQEYIDEVLKRTDVTGNKVFPEGNVLDVLDKMVWYMDEPFSSTSQYAQWSVFESAKKFGLTVMLDGQGADEQLAGYTGFYSVILAECLKKLQIRRFFHELRCYKTLRAKTEKHVKSYKIIIEAFISAFLPRKIQQFGKIHFFYNRRVLPFSKKQIRDTIYGISLYPANDYRQYTLDNIDCNLSMLLHYEDRNSMAHSIESRTPFMDYRLAELMFAMPISYKIQNGVTKYILRESLDGVLPDKIKNRYSKLGFVTPEDQWINNNAEIFRKEIEIASETLSSLINPEAVINWYSSIEGKIERRDFLPWRIICASHWIKVFDLKL